MRQNAEIWKPFWESLLKVLWTRGWEVTILAYSVVINEILNCSPSFIYDTLRSTQTNWRKTNGKQTKNCIREMRHRLQELSVLLQIWIPNVSCTSILWTSILSICLHPEVQGGAELPTAAFTRTKCEHIQLQQPLLNLAGHWFSYHSATCMSSAWWIAV